jgi:hypothetical protein
MRCSQLVLIVAFGLGMASLNASAQQSQGGNAPDNRASAVPATSQPAVAPDAAVITVHGLCEKQPPLLNLGQTLPPFPDKSPDGSDGGAPSSGCNTVVTRIQFENLINALNPKTRPDKRRRFADDYSETVLYAQQGRQLGLDKTPEFQELVRFRNMEALSQMYKRYMQQRASEISDADLEKFYKENLARFEQFGLKRVFVPKEKIHDAAHPAISAAADQAEMKKVAERIRGEAAAGADFDLLQEKAYKAAGDTESVLETDLGDKWTRDNLPPGYLKAVSAMQPGQVAEPVLFGDGWYIFKLVSRQTIPLSEARAQMQSLTINDLAKSLKKSIKPDLNGSYFVSGPIDNGDAPPGAQ